MKILLNFHIKFSLFYSHSSLKLTSLWQLTNGKKFAQLIFNEKNLIDCEFIDEEGDGEFVREFVDKFIGDFNYIREEKLSGSKHAKHHQWNSELFTTMKSNVKFIQLKKLNDIPEHIREMLNLKKLKKSCNQLHRQIRMKVREGGEKKEEILNQEIDTENMKR